MKNILFKTMLYILEGIFIFIIHAFLRKNSLPKFVNYNVSSNGLISSFFYLIYIPPLLLLLRILFQTYKNVSQKIFLIQNCYLFVFFFTERNN